MFTVVHSGVRDVHLFSLLCCPIMCLYVLSSMLWRLLRFPHKTMFGLSLPPVVCRMAYLRYLCLFACKGVKHILCCVFVFVLVFCTLCYQFFRIVHFWLPLRYSLTFIFSSIHNAIYVEHPFCLLKWNSCLLDTDIYFVLFLMHAIVIMNTVYIIIAIHFSKMCSKHLYHLDLEHNSIYLFHTIFILSVNDHTGHTGV